MAPAQITATDLAIGYDGRPFKTIEKESGPGGPQWMSDHPNPGNRYDYITQEAKMLRVARALGRAFPVTVRTTLLAAHTLPPEFLDRADQYIDTIARDVLTNPVIEEYRIEFLD